MVFSWTLDGSAKVGDAISPYWQRIRQQLPESKTITAPVQLWISQTVPQALQWVSK